MLRNTLESVTVVRTGYKSVYIDISTHFQELFYHPLATLLSMRPFFTGKNEQQSVIKNAFQIVALNIIRYYME